MSQVSLAFALSKSKYGACSDLEGYICCYTHECPGVTSKEIEAGCRQILRLMAAKTHVSLLNPAAGYAILKTGKAIEAATLE